MISVCVGSLGLSLGSGRSEYLAVHAGRTCSALEVCCGGKGISHIFCRINAVIVLVLLEVEQAACRNHTQLRAAGEGQWTARDWAELYITPLCLSQEEKVKHHTPP